MNSANEPVSMDTIADVLASVRKKGVRLWSENGQLRYAAPKGVLTQGEFERLRILRSHIVALLDRVTGAEIAELACELHRRLDHAPLSFSQVAHWNLYRLGERRAIRQIASATRLRGRLNGDALQESITEILRRHDALRTRIVVLDGVPVQEISESRDCELEVDDLRALPEGSRELEVKRLIEQLILEPIDVAAGPLFGMRLLRLRDDEHVLIVAMEHMISDAFSMNILLRDLFTAYMQASNGRAFSLPAIPLQFADYAVWQRNARKSWIEKQAAYLNEHLTGCQRLRFPEDQKLQIAPRFGWGTVPLKIGRDLKAELSEWCRLKRTTVVMSIFTAYVGLVLRWCDASESVIQYQHDGRVSPKIENTIGYFASILYLRIALRGDDSFIDLMNRVTEEYCQAHEHADFSCVAAQVPRPEFTRNAAFNWIPQGSKTLLSNFDESECMIARSPVPFAHPMLKSLETDSEPAILLYDSDDEIVGDVHFRLDRFSVGTMERFVRNLLVFIRALLRQPEVPVKDVLLV